MGIKNSSMRVKPSRDSTARLAEYEYEEFETPGDGGFDAIARAIAAACQRNPELKEAIKNQCFNNPKTPRPSLAEIKLSYDKDGWTRTIRATDMKFQWTRFDTDGNVDTRHRFDTERSAYVRKLDWEADDDRMRKGRVSLVTPDLGAVDSKIKSANGTDLVTFQDLPPRRIKVMKIRYSGFKIRVLSCVWIGMKVI
jgi:hypothetical protein